MVFVISFLVLRQIVNSPFGQALEGIREDETRMRHLGYNTWLYKYIAFIIGGFFAGVAGVFFAHWMSIIQPYNLGITFSALALVFVIIGGAGTLVGPVIGVVLVSCIEYVSSMYVADRWPLILGVLFVLTITFLRGGVYKHLTNFWKKVGRYG